MIPFIIWTVILLLVRNRFSIYYLTNIILYPDSGLWFLWVLFFICVLFSVCIELSAKLRIKQNVIILAVCLLLVALMVILEIRVFGFQLIAYYFLFYSLGYFLHKYNDIIVTKNVYVIVLLSMLWGVLAWFWQMHSLPVILNRIQLPVTMIQYGYRFVTAAIACYVLIAVSPIVLCHTSKINLLLSALGKVSLGIYAVHMILMGMIVRWYSDIGMDSLMTITCSFITGLFTSWLIVWLLSKWKTTNTLLLGKV